MARQQADRDDLFAEICTFSPRWELQLNIPQERIIAGCRSDGRWSLYRQAGDYLQFLEDGRLRRAFWDGAILLSTGTGLARLDRTRTSTQAILSRSELSDADVREFLSSVRNHLQQWAAAMEAGEFEVLRSVPAGSDPRIQLVPLIRRAIAADPALAPGIARP